MPVAFNPPPFPTADTTLSAQVDANADASIPQDAFSQLLLAAGGDAPSIAGGDPREALVRGRLLDVKNLRGLTEASLRLAADGKSAAALLGARDAHEPIEAAGIAGTQDARARADDEVPVDTAAIVAALNAAIAASPKAEASIEAEDSQPLSGQARDGEEASAERTIPDAPLPALPASAAELAMPAMVAQVDVRNAQAAAPMTARTEKAAAVEGAKVASAARTIDTPLPGSKAGEAVAASMLPAAKELPHAALQSGRTKGESMAAIVPAAIAAPMSDASAAVATAKELLGDSVSKLKEALERSGSAVSAQSISTPQGAAAQAPASVQTIETPVGAPGFEDELAGKLAHVVMLRNDRVEFHLHPAELGPVDVQISFASDQAVVLITAPQAATRDALEQTLPYLRDMLADQGIALGQATVQGERNPAEQDHARRDGAAPAQAGSTHAATEVEVRPARLRGLVDVFA